MKARQASNGPSTDIVMLPEGAPNVASIKTVEVRRQPLARTLRVAGMIEDDDSKHRILSAYTGGRIEKLFVNFEGAEVQAGQPLATFYSKDLIAAIREYKVAYGQGPSPMLTASAVRLQQLGLSEDQIATAHQRSETDIFVDILAPVTGTVVKRYVYEGQYVQEGEKLFEIADFSKMWFQFIAYEQDLPFLQARPEGDRANPGVAGQSLPGANQIHQSEHRRRDPLSARSSRDRQSQSRAAAQALCRRNGRARGAGSAGCAENRGALAGGQSARLRRSTMARISSAA